MYYIIESNYVGPNKDQAIFIDADTIVIATTPPLTNSSHEARTHGWCGTTNDWAVYAHGEFETLDAAREQVRNQFGEVRELELDNCYDKAAVAIFKPGKYPRITRRETADWIFVALRADISADTTDAEIQDFAEQYQRSANEEGFALHEDLSDLITQYRDEMQNNSLKGKKMATLSDRLNFSDTQQAGAIEIKKWEGVNFYETLCLYCADHNIDLSDIDEDDFDGCSFIMQDYGQADKSTDSYWFWID